LNEYAFLSKHFHLKNCLVFCGLGADSADLNVCAMKMTTNAHKPPEGLATLGGPDNRLKRSHAAAREQTAYS